MQHRKKNGATFGKAKRELPIRKIALMRINGMGWKTISTELSIPRTTIKDREKDILSEIDKIKGMSDKVGTVGRVSDGEGVE